MKYVKKKLTEIRPYENNPRIIDDAVDDVVESIRHVVCPDPAEDRRVKDQAVDVLRMLRGKASDRDRAPAPAQHVDPVRAGLTHDLIHRGADILFILRHYTEIISAGLLFAERYYAFHTLYRRKLFKHTCLVADYARLHRVVSGELRREILRRIVGDYLTAVYNYYPLANRLYFR